MIHEDAANDIRRARDFYNAIQLGLGTHCAQSLWADLQRLTFSHGMHGCHFGFYRMLSVRFPFGIYYRDTLERTEVFAVLDLRRAPSALSQVLGGRGHRM